MSSFADFERPEDWIKEPPRKNGKAKPNGNGHDHAANDATPPALECSRLDPIGANKIPPRPWAYGKFLLFGSASVIGAVDGAGKGTIAAAMVIAFITGKPLLGERVWRTGPVGIISYEDDETEWHRRIAAACILFEVDYEYVIANLFFIHRRGGRVVFAERMLTGKTLFPDGDEIIELLRSNSAVLLIVDPFNHAHAMDDGNNNVLIARVADEISRIAREAHVAALVLHHLRKGSNGSLDDLMGATSLRANFRGGCRILARMTTDEASKLNISDPWRYLRIGGVKTNYAPPPERATWFRLASVPLGNAADIYLEGDEIGVAEPWTPRPVFEGMDATTLRAVFEALRAKPHAPDTRAKYAPWAGRPLIAAGGRAESEASRIVTAWRNSGLLVEDDCYRDVQRRKRITLALDEVKAGEILAGLEAATAGTEQE